MQLRSKLNSLLLSALWVMSFVLSGQAASPPSGAYTFDLAAATIFDLSGTYPPTEVLLNGGHGTISDLTLNVDAQGKITGTGSMHVHTDERGDAMSDDATIAVSGRIQSSGEVTRVRLKLQMKDGKGTEDGQPMTFSVTLNFQGEIQESLIKGKLSGGGLTVVNGRKERLWLPRSEAQFELLEDAEALLGVKLDGINVQTNIVSGTGQVILKTESATNRFFNCRVTGRHDQETGITRLSLRGDKEKGSAGVLVNVIGESGEEGSFAVNKYSGKLMGQRVRTRAVFAPDKLQGLTIKVQPKWAADQGDDLDPFTLLFEAATIIDVEENIAMIYVYEQTSGTTASMIVTGQDGLETQVILEFTSPTTGTYMLYSADGEIEETGEFSF